MVLPSTRERANIRRATSRGAKRPSVLAGCGTQKSLQPAEVHRSVEAEQEHRHYEWTRTNAQSPAAGGDWKAEAERCVHSRDQTHALRRCGGSNHCAERQGLLFALPPDTGILDYGRVVWLPGGPALMSKLGQLPLVAVTAFVVLTAVGCSSTTAVKGAGGQTSIVGAGGQAGITNTGGQTSIVDAGGQAGITSTGGNAGSDVGATGGMSGGGGGSPVDAGLDADVGSGNDALGANQPLCQPVLNSAKLDTGLDSCDDGTTRRRTALVCPLPAMRSADAGASPPGPCAADTECGNQSICAEAHNLRGYSGCFSGCRQDSDCGAGSICVCGVVLGQCMPANCKTNADCGVGFGCLATGEGPAGGCAVGMAVSTPNITRYVCQQAQDACFATKDCPGGVPPSQPDGGSSWPACIYGGAKRVCGYACAGRV